MLPFTCSSQYDHWQQWNRKSASDRSEVRRSRAEPSDNFRISSSYQVNRFVELLLSISLFKSSLKCSDTIVQFTTKKLYTSGQFKCVCKVRHVFVPRNFGTICTTPKWRIFGAFYSNLTGSTGFNLSHINATLLKISLLSTEIRIEILYFEC